MSKVLQPMNYLQRLGGFEHHVWMGVVVWGRGCEHILCIAMHLYPSGCSFLCSHVCQSKLCMSKHKICVMSKLLPFISWVLDFKKQVLLQNWLTFFLCKHSFCCCSSAPLSTGLSRQEDCSGLPCPSQGVFPTQESNRVSCSTGGLFTSWTT